MPLILFQHLIDDALLIGQLCTESNSWQLEKMPAELEADFALSALPPYIRDKATVYLLDPLKATISAGRVQMVLFALLRVPNGTG